MKTTGRAYCTHEGCKEVANYEYDSRKDYMAASESRNKWKCTRHSRPDEVLSVNNPSRSVEMIAGKSKKYPQLDGNFWSEKSSFQYGPGFKVYAGDFPEGTKLIITAQIVLPT